ncbi:spore coat protein [Virgibacillus kimchii]
MDNQQQNQSFQDASQMPAEQTFGGHEMFDAHRAISTLAEGMEQHLLYEQHVQDPELKTMMQQHQTYLTTLYNTIVETLKTGQKPSVSTITYNMTQDTNVIFGMQPSQPTSPAQSMNEIGDQQVTSYMMSCLKQAAVGFTNAAMESTNPVMRRVLADSVPNLIEMAYEIFLYQNKNQYYQVPQMKQQDMEQYKNKFAPIQGNMPH